MAPNSESFDDLREEKGIRYAGMGSGTSLLVIPAAGALGVCGISYLVRGAAKRDEIREIITLPDAVLDVFGTVGWWSAFAALALFTLLILLSIYPLRAFRLWFPTQENRHVRRVGLRAARRWKRLARASFSPVRSARRERVYPGLRSAKVDGGHLVLRLRLPEDRVPGTREKYLETAANELKAELRVRAVIVGKLDGRHATLFITVRDLTEDVREVEL